jgi:hypothetical protein
VVPELPELELSEVLLEPVLLLPGVSAAPVAELFPDKPKYENTLCRQLGCVRSVLASKLGADSNLLVSPAKVKLGCCILELPFAENEPEEELRKSIQGTATCLPPEDELEELIPVALVELVLELLWLPFPLTEITANSTLPEIGLITVSLIVPTCVPVVFLTSAPVSWLPRKASCPMRPVALK